MARLILINGAPGSGKSTLAEALADRAALTLALDVDQIKHALGRWDEDRTVSGLQARRLALALAREHLLSGHDVVIGQYLARTEFIEALEELARSQGVSFCEFLLVLDSPSLERRLRGRVEAPSRPEHSVHNMSVGPADAERLVESMASLRSKRPNARCIDATGSLSETLESIISVLD
ncbi:MAG TPA: AAA family ATPase [Sinomonas sp.]|nr:AAA family ATPase [Sinomonas sp.]